MIAIVIFAILGLIMFFVLNSLYKRTNHYKNLILNVQKFIDGVDNNIELASFGSSYAKFGIIPQQNEKSNTFFENFYLL